MPSVASSRDASEAHRSPTLLRDGGQQNSPSRPLVRAARQGDQTVYKYALQVIDVASRFKVSRPLKTKKASEVAEMFKDIYKKGPLQYPGELRNKWNMVIYDVVRNSGV